MNIIIHSKNIDLTDAMKTYVEDKIGEGIAHYFNETEHTPIYVNLSTFKNNHCIEVTVPLGDLTIRAEEKTADMYKSIDLVEEKLKRQIRKYKTRVNRKMRKEQLYVPLETIAEIDADKEEVVRLKKFDIKPMSVEEAILQMNLLDHDFFVFKDADTNEMNVLYKRKDEYYGLITSDAV
ncbi:ribosome hibernation-promoting factor, HPF/YfiA family [Bacillus taeanensis]|uniref:Ribosome hibernation promoting factor n=1 Tax=Bacillus taeanensis TaxID=273032 RepID=A0A366XTC5_9BACI|nr:ribosome-associated translation inhibitor RaiA [Bacillus taeanensis]RBW68916.1 ribosome-associated translation inhibitor RaiA [Bacillus taeanensis]